MDAMLIPTDERADVRRIVEIFQRQGIILDPLRASRAWEQRSDMLAAGWLYLPDSDEEVFREVMMVLKDMDYVP